MKLKGTVIFVQALNEIISSGVWSPQWMFQQKRPKHLSISRQCTTQSSQVDAPRDENW